jgi:transposase
MARRVEEPIRALPEDPLAALQFAVTTRRHFQQAELRLANQIWALQHPGGRKGDPTKFGTQSGTVADSPVIAELTVHLKAIATKRRHWEKIAATLAKEHSLWPWAEAIRGLGPLSFGQMVAEAGDLTRLDNPAKLWKRMGLAVMDGKAQRRLRGAQGVEHGFSPRRRAVMAVIADNLVRLNKDGYRTLYVERKAYEAEKNSELKLIHRDKRAKRYMAKRLLKDFWTASRGSALPNL